ncbi:EutN/CcmL family microcompartment protein [Cellulosilyticum sp. I15G10I2]|uniref:EutN/CcmL family microcompartment protein n=1 Tax=Cellulosilyticum sp. I15G10I2 TaxID=1892843 RepID=UPI00085C6420|nr:EutN/CcmL family microcompartment protein [Cellulosilyticum sp. I15G10I2]
MTIAKVIGSIISTRKHPALIGNKFLMVETLACMDAGKERFIAIDTVGAGIGEMVLITRGSSARCSIDNINAPIDAAIVGIVDDENHIGE